MTPTKVGPNTLTYLVVAVVSILSTFLLWDLHSLTHFRPSMTLDANLLIIGVILVVSLLSFALYRFNFHPLAKYPGPWLAAITDWYTVYHCMTGDRHLDFYRLHREYGPIVRFGPNRLSFNTNTALTAIYGTNANTQKSQVYSAFGHFFKVPASLTTIDKTQHAFKRRVTAQALNQKSIQQLEEVILKNIRRLCDVLYDHGSAGKEWGPSHNMTEIISYAVSDIMGDITFSRSWNTQNSPENRHILKLLPQGTCGINLSGHMPLLLKLNLDRLLFGTLAHRIRKFHALSASISDWRVSQPPLHDLFAHLLEARDPQTGLGYTQPDLVAEAGILIVGGSGTTATTLTATLFYLLHYPDALATLRQEILARFSTLDDIRIGAALTSCHYLFACLDESMRLSPAIPALLPREILPGGLTIDTHPVPPGTDVGVPIYSLHHSSEYHPDPFRFVPSRWLPSPDDGPGQAALALSRSAFCPFGAGRTGCVGRYLAYQEMGIALARMLWLFEMRLAPGKGTGEGGAGLGEGRGRREEFQLWDRFVGTHEGPLVQFRPRC